MLNRSYFDSCEGRTGRSRYARVSQFIGLGFATRNHGRLATRHLGLPTPHRARGNGAGSQYRPPSPSLESTSCNRGKESARKKPNSEKMSQEPAYIIDRPGLVEFPFGDTTPLESAKRSQFDNDPFAAWPTVDMMKSVKGLDTNGKMSAMFTPRFSPREGAPKRKLRVVHIGAGASGIYTVVRRNWSLPYVVGCWTCVCWSKSQCSPAKADGFNLFLSTGTPTLRQKHAHWWNLDRKQVRV